MTPRDLRLQLRDILTASMDVRTHVGEMTFDEYLGDLKTRHAVERCMSIIGEALGKAVSLDSTLIGRITDARSIIGLRNRLSHAYFATDDAIVWSAIRSGLPKLVADVERVLREFDDPSGG